MDTDYNRILSSFKFLNFYGRLIFVSMIIKSFIICIFVFLVIFGGWMGLFECSFLFCSSSLFGNKVFNYKKLADSDSFRVFFCYI